MDRAKAPFTNPASLIPFAEDTDTAWKVPSLHKSSDILRWGWLKERPTLLYIGRQQ